MAKSAAGARRQGHIVLAGTERPAGRAFFGIFLAGSLVFHIVLYGFLLVLEPAGHHGGVQLIEVAFSYRGAPAIPAVKKQTHSAEPGGLAHNPEKIVKAESKAVPANEGKAEGSEGSAALSSGSGTYLDDAFALWIAGIQRRISSLLAYPRLARENGIEGTAIVRFAVDPGGRVLDAQIMNSSGSNLLDAEALRIVRRASPFPPPSGTERKYFSMPVTFTLK